MAFMKYHTFILINSNAVKNLIIVAKQAAASFVISIIMMSNGFILDHCASSLGSRGKVEDRHWGEFQNWGDSLGGEREMGHGRLEFIIIK